MKVVKYILLFIGLTVSINLKSQVRFAFTDGIGNGPLKEKMETNVSQLLTEINRAGFSNTNINLSGIQMEEEAKSRLNALCQDLNIVCEKVFNQSSCLEDYQGYQIRQIPVIISPKESSGEQSIRELTVSLNKNGLITGARLAWEMEEGRNRILNNSSKVSDARERLEILKWVEDFRCYYNEKNIKALSQIYSDDALIITGSVVLSQNHSSDFTKMIENNVNYKVQSKEQYLNKLSQIFAANKRINVKFDNIEVRRHGSRPHIYGVTLRQEWQSGSYKDSGWLFLLWDFNNPEYPQIYVRTWHPEEVSKEDLPNVYSFPYSN